MSEPERHETLSGAIELRPHELISLVGAGGKTAAVRLLAAEAATRGDRVLAGTTTSMFLAQLAAVGTLTRHEDFASLLRQVRLTAHPGHVLAVATASDRPSPAGEVKIDGLPLAWVDGLWQEDLADTFLVEADGSRGKLLKTFGPHEPVLPTRTTTIVLLAGLGIIGARITEENVHRAAILAGALSIEEGASLTPRMLCRALQIQISLLKMRSPDSRVVVLLNQAEQPQAEKTGVCVARELLAAAQSAFLLPERVVVGTVREERFLTLLGGR